MPARPGHEQARDETISRPSFIAELQRRNVHRAALFYAGAAWLLVQIAALIGFAPAMLFAWFYEITPEGVKRESELDHSRPAARRSGRWLDRWIIAVLALAVVLLLADRLVPRKAAVAAREKSIAVLPSTDLSPAHDQDYFSDGMAEELLNALARVQDLKVAGRTSSIACWHWTRCCRTA